MRERSVLWSLLAVLTLTVAVFPALAQPEPGFTEGEALKAGGDSDVRPGETNPVMNPNRRTLFRDDEVMMFADYMGEDIIHRAIASPQTSALDDWTTTTGNEDEYHPIYDYEEQNRLCLAAGRITDNDNDQVVRARFVDDLKVFIELLDHNGQVIASTVIDDHNDNGNYSRLAVAVGDFVVERDENGFYHDEIAVARVFKKDGSYHVAIDLLDRNLDTIVSGGAGHTDHVWHIRLEPGDFNGDGTLELAVILFYTNSDFTVRSYWYDYDTNELSHQSQFCGHCSGDGYGWDTAAGDFDGDGRDDIALLAYHLWFLSANDDLTFFNQRTVKPPWSYPEPYDDKGILLSGLFHFDPANGFGLNRRQLAWVWSRPSYDEEKLGLRVDFVWVDDDCTVSSMGGIDVEQDDYAYFANVDASAGNFAGRLDDNTSPVMQVMVSYLALCAPPTVIGQIVGPAYAKPMMACVDLGGNAKLAQCWSWEGPVQSTSDPAPSTWYSQLAYVRTAVTAYDRDGDTYRLGAPLHIVAQRVVGLDCVLQEPPKHADFLPRPPQDGGPVDWDGDWGMINVSYDPDFVVAYRDESGKTVQTETKNTSDWSIGGSVKTTAEMTTSAGGPSSILSGSVTAGAKASVSYDYDEHESNWNGQYESRTTSISMETNRDDVLYGKLQLLDIWRYRIYGLTNDDGTNAFQDIVIPGSCVNFTGGGLNYDWYQPVHQNHNLLSYPALPAQAQDFPDDVGPFELPDGSQVTDVMTGRSTYDYDGNYHNISLEWTSAAGGGSEKSWDHTLAESAELSLSYTGSAGVPDVSETEVTFGVKVGFHNSNSWGGSVSEQSTTSETQGVSIDIPANPLPDNNWPLHLHAGCLCRRKRRRPEDRPRHRLRPARQPLGQLLRRPPRPRPRAPAPYRRFGRTDHGRLPHGHARPLPA